jgi:hypothetical protein
MQDPAFEWRCILPPIILRVGATIEALEIRDLEKANTHYIGVDNTPSHGRS